MQSIGLVGVGKWGCNWARTLWRLPDAELRYCCDVSEARREWVKQQFSDVQVTGDFQALLKDNSLDAVVLATAVPTHFQLAQQALRAGKHVLVEKPLCLSSDEAADLVGLARAHRRILMVGHLLEYHPAIRFIKQMIDDGDLGDVHYLYSQRLNLGTIRRDENAWWSLAPHDISVACRLFSESPVAVQCLGQNVVQPDVADVVFANLTFGSGRLAHIHVSWLDPHKTRKLTVVGSKRMVSFDDTLPNYQVMVYDKSVTLNGEFETYADWISMHQGDIVMPRIRPSEPLLEEARHFIRCVETGSRPLSDGQAGLDVVSVLQQGALSLKQNGSRQRIGQPGRRLQYAA